MRLIDADALMADIERTIENSGCVNHEGEIMDCIRYASEVDAAPVVRGEWTSLTECSNEGVYCSVCHKKVWKADYAICTKTNKIRSNYCPNCGAKMEDKP